MPTDKQLAANRANAKKSTGPRTPAGKAVAARNASRHRLLMENILLRSEDRKGFTRVLRRFYNEHQPQGPTERSLVDLMVTTYWRLIRTVGLEAAGLDFELGLQQARTGASPRAVTGVPADITLGELPSDVRTVAAYRSWADNSPSVAVLHRLESRLQRQYESALKQLQFLKQQRAKPGAFDSLMPPFDPVPVDPSASGPSSSERDPETE